MEEKPSKQILEVREILRQRWLKRKAKQEEEKKAKEQELKNKAFMLRFLSKFELNKIKRNAYRIGKFSKRKLLFKLDNEDYLKKVPGYFRVRFKFTKDNLFPPVLQSEQSKDEKVKRIRRFKSKKKKTNKITEIGVLTVGMEHSKPKEVPIESLTEEEQIQRAMEASMSYEEEMLQEALKSSLKDIEPKEKETIQIPGDDDPLLMQAILNSINSNNDPLEQPKIKSVPNRSDFETNDEFTHYLGFDIRDLSLKLEEPIKFDGKELYLDIQQRKYLSELWMKINPDNPIGHMRLIKLRKSKSLCKDAHKRNLFITG